MLRSKSEIVDEQNTIRRAGNAGAEVDTMFHVNEFKVRERDRLYRSEETIPSFSWGVRN